MKTFWERFSVTKLVLLLIILSLITIELYKTFNWWELDQVFVDVLIMVTSYYFAQKGIKYESVDSLIKSDPLIDWEKDNGQPL